MKVILTAIFSVMIISMILPASALQQSAASMIYELELGNTQTLVWTLISDSSKDVIIKMSKSGEGSELLSFPLEVKLPAKRAIKIAIDVTIPNNYENNIILKPKITATSEGVADSGATVINVAMSKTLEIKIGKNPIFTEAITEQPVVTTTPKADVVTDPGYIDEPQPKSQMVIGSGETQEIPVVTTTPKADVVTNPTYIDEPQMKCGKGTEFVDGYCKVIGSDSEGGSCLIATAAFGTELAPQVQFLREIRDNTVLSTASGTAFMSGFNTLYYSFAPTIADMERENPMFQETVRVFITPMISTLSIMSLADNGNDAQVLGLGISVIALNLAMYIGIPIGTVIMIRQKTNLTRFNSH